MHILITGGAGFIGSRLALKLVERGHRVRVLDNLSEQIHGEQPEGSTLYRSILGNVDFHRGDVTNSADISRALCDVNAVVHFAAETGTGQSMYAIDHYARTNVLGTSQLLDHLAKGNSRPSKLIVASSRAIYGEGAYKCAQHGIVYPSARDEADMREGHFAVRCPQCRQWADPQPTSETAPVRPASVYGITKFTQEQLFLTVGAALEIPTIAFRYQNVYGPGQSLANPYTGILAIFTTRIRDGNGINIFEDGQESRDFVYIDDVVDATVAGLEHPGHLNVALNVGSGRSASVSQMAETLQALIGTQVPTRISGQFRVGDIRHSIADLTQVRETLKFAPKTDILAGLEQFVAWATEQKKVPDLYEQSLKELRSKGLFKG